MQIAPSLLHELVALAALAAAALTPLGCESRPPPEHPPLAHEELHMLTDCPWVADGCDDDGCSEKEGHATPPAPPWALRPATRAACGGAVVDAVLFDVAGQLRGKAALSRVLVVAPAAACGAAVQEELVALGAPAGRTEIAVREGVRYVHYDVAAWNGARCENAGRR